MDGFAPTTEGPYQKVDEVAKNFKNRFKPNSKKSTKPVLRNVEPSGGKGEVRAEAR